METGKLTPKELKDQDLIQIHRNLYIKFTKLKIKSLANRNMALRIYDNTISTKNIRLYYNHHINIFAFHLLTDDLESIIKHETF